MANVLHHPFLCLHSTLQLRTLISWFMTDVGGAIEHLTIHVRGTRGATHGEVQLEMGDVVSDWHDIEALDSIDVWAVMASFGLVPMRPARTFTTIEGQQPTDSRSVGYLERNATCKLSAHEASLLQRIEPCCAICQEPYHVGNMILALPCGGSGPGASLHCGHKKCLISWLRRADSCPLCRTALPRRGESGLNERLQQAHARLRAFKEESERRSRSHSTHRSSLSTSGAVTGASPSTAVPGTSRSLSLAAAKKRDEERLWKTAMGVATKGLRGRRAGTPGRGVVAQTV